MPSSRLWAKVLDWVADPRESPDSTYQRQVELLTKLQQGAGEARADAARARLEVRVELSRVHLEAREAADHLAREAVTRRAGIGRLLSDLAALRESWPAEADRYTAICEQLASETGR